ELEMKVFKDNHNLDSKHHDEIKRHIETFSSKYNADAIQTLREKAAAKAVEAITHWKQAQRPPQQPPSQEFKVAGGLLHMAQILNVAILDPEATDVQRLEILMGLREQVIALYQDPQYAPAWEGQEEYINEVIKDLSEAHQEMSILMDHGLGIIDGIESGLHRKIIKESVELLAAIIGLVSSVLFISFP